MRSSGPQHDLTFHVKINLGTFTAEGTGKTKKAAKAHAAQLLMELINPGGNNPQDDISMRKGDQRGNANFVGELQEFCQQKKWPLPVYEEEAGQSSWRTCRCKVRLPMEEYRGSVSIHVKGSGKTKRVAKERAAENALDQVQLFARAIASEPQRPIEDVD
ncbi:A-dependent protein kinase activator [Collichthys lucidus]|uniref:A-dependent protein kinase activator n=1 Tax=Collichthys lucidus TaxID=240159 RepID=A0A4V6AQ38_COLLU|nr:A-dependent protein kinase activator [Collichthys lucidus]